MDHRTLTQRKDNTIIFKTVKSKDQPYLLIKKFRRNKTCLFIFQIYFTVGNLFATNFHPEQSGYLSMPKLSDLLPNEINESVNEEDY